MGNKALDGRLDWHEQRHGMQADYILCLPADKHDRALVQAIASVTAEYQALPGFSRVKTVEHSGATMVWHTVWIEFLAKLREKLTSPDKAKPKRARQAVAA